MTTATSSTLAPSPCSLFVAAPRPMSAVPTSYGWCRLHQSLPLAKSMATASTPVPARSRRSWRFPAPRGLCRPRSSLPTSSGWVPPAPIAALPLAKPMAKASTPAPLPCVSFVMLCPKIAVIWCCGY
ncbi:hypothetical protein PR003_g30640 [Phytophthora rubi]|uniref:Uncharacterized protein n=1 Tax=Phytophthora rubi TaxID=129364 RepID=A0A6A4BAT1_9STRA|nr:hypothetical protein PR003_g30640 [Phytophthora rubi]